MALFRPQRAPRPARRAARRGSAMPRGPGGARARRREGAPRARTPSWLPSAPGTSLYVRPFIFATEPFLGVRPSKQVPFAVIVSPVGGYFSGPPRPLRIWVEQERARAARGGIGGAKAAANYVASLQAAEDAKARGLRPGPVARRGGAPLRRGDRDDELLREDRRAGRHAGARGDDPRRRDARLRDPALPRRGRPGRGAAASRSPSSPRRARRGRSRRSSAPGTASLVAPIGELAWGAEKLDVPARPGALGEKLRGDPRRDPARRGAGPARLARAGLGRPRTRLDSPREFR